MQRLFDTKAVASHCGVSEITLRKWRIAGFGPPFIKMGANVRYRESDVEAWLASRVTQSTSEADELDRPDYPWDR